MLSFLMQHQLDIRDLAAYDVAAASVAVVTGDGDQHLFFFLINSSEGETHHLVNRWHVP